MVSLSWMNKLKAIIIYTIHYRFIIIIIFNKLQTIALLMTLLFGGNFYERFMAMALLETYCVPSLGRSHHYGMYTPLVNAPWVIAFGDSSGQSGLCGIIRY